jgi:hypothetical protein
VYAVRNATVWREKKIISFSHSFDYGALEVECLSLREFCEGHLKGGSFTGDPGGSVKEGSGGGHLCPYGPRWGTWKGVLLLGTLGEVYRKVLETGISVHMGSAGKPGRGLFYWGLWRKCKGRPWRRASLSIWAPLGNLEGGSYTGDFER